MEKPLLILQIRPEDAAVDNEYDAFVKSGNLDPDKTERLRINKDSARGVDLDDYSGVVVGGGPYNISDKDKPKEQIRLEAELHDMLDEIIERDMPFFGACYGLGILSVHLGVEVSKDKYSEPVGSASIELTDEAENDPITTGLSKRFAAFGGHKEAAQSMSSKATLLATNEACPVQMIRVGKNVYATQFHPELDFEGLALRINIYKNAGYFPPEDADRLINDNKDTVVTAPQAMFERWANRLN